MSNRCIVGKKSTESKHVIGNVIYEKVAIKEALSELDDLKAGVSQGSVLGPLLCLVFINDIADDMLGFSRLFADDTSIDIQPRFTCISKSDTWKKICYQVQSK
jgi:hypothetical protein